MVPVPYPGPAVTHPLLQDPQSQHPQQLPETPAPTPNKSGYSTLPTAPNCIARVIVSQRSKLCHSPQVPLKEGYITVVEEACFQLPPGRLMNLDQTPAAY